VVTNFLAFARPAELTLMPVDLGAIASRVAADLAKEATDRGGRIEVDGEFATVDGDEVLLRQAFSNLVRNAVEAGLPPGAPTAVAVRGSVDRGAGVVHVEVHDDGRGIDPSIADRIFQPFFSTKGRGTGLGLSLVQKIVVTHNGRVVVTPSPRGGACFRVTLPLRQ